MNLLEDAGGRICGTEYMFCHALDPIPQDLPPMEALARMALADPMVGSPRRSGRADLPPMPAAFRAEAVVVSRIPGASHCAMEGAIIAEMVRRAAGVPVVEIEVPPVADALRARLRTRLEALVETVQRDEEIAKMICAGIDAGSRTDQGRLCWRPRARGGRGGRGGSGSRAGRRWRRAPRAACWPRRASTGGRSARSSPPATAAS